MRHARRFKLAFIACIVACGALAWAGFGSSQGGGTGAPGGGEDLAATLVLGNDVGGTAITAAGVDAQLTLSATGGGINQRVQLLSAGTGTPSAILLQASAGGFAITGNAESVITNNFAPLTIVTEGSGLIRIQGAGGIDLVPVGANALTIEGSGATDLSINNGVITGEGLVSIASGASVQVTAPATFSIQLGNVVSQGLLQLTPTSSLLQAASGVNTLNVRGGEGAFGDGGPLIAQGGMSGTAAGNNSGDALFAGGDSGNSQSDGGDATLRGGSSGGILGVAGNCIVDAGDPVTGTAGTVTIGGTDAGAITVGRAGVAGTFPGGYQATSNAVIATSDGLTTGLVTTNTSVVTTAVATDADDIITLPVPIIGMQIRVYVGGTGHEVRTVAASNVTINNVDSDGTNELALAANTYVTFECVSATAWIVRGFDNVGADLAALVPD